MKIPKPNLVIVADKNIPNVRDAFGRLGVLRLVDSKEITPLSVADCDILLIRYVSCVGKALLAGSRVKYVATVSAGTDHIDLKYLRSKKIGFSSAPGSNAESVAEYTTAALLWLHEHGKIRLPGAVLGVVGVGNVGSRVAQKARALGMKVLLNDPPKRRYTGDKVYLPLSKLMDADVITIHTPLNMSGRDKTVGLFGASLLGRLKPGVVIINTARGGIVSERALSAAIASGRVGAAILDVWENEPDIDPGLVKMVDIATPHVAGLSREARSNALSMIHAAVCAHFQLPARWFPPILKLLPLSSSGDRAETDCLGIVGGLIRQGYNIEKDSVGFRRLAFKIPIKAAFSAFRKRYNRRTEFGSRKTELSKPFRRLCAVLSRLGFKVS